MNLLHSFVQKLGKNEDLRQSPKKLGLKLSQKLKQNNWLAVSNFRKRIYRSETHQIGEIQFQLNSKAIRKIYLFVKKPHGNIIVNAPRQVPLKTIIDFISSKSEWIASARQRIFAKKAQESPKFEAGEVVKLFGEELELEVEFGGKTSKFCIKNFDLSCDLSQTKPHFGNSQSVLSQHFQAPSPIQLNFDFDLNSATSALIVGQALEKKKLLLKTNSDALEATKKMALEKFYRIELMQKLLKMVEKWEKIIAVKAIFVGVKKMRTRHGSCNTRHARIWFALDLAKKPIEAIEYVVVHELVHLLEASHNRRFVALMTKFLPDWQSRKKML